MFFDIKLLYIENVFGQIKIYNTVTSSLKLFCDFAVSTPFLSRENTKYVAYI